MGYSRALELSLENESRARGAFSHFAHCPSRPVTEQVTLFCAADFTLTRCLASWYAFVTNDIMYVTHLISCAALKFSGFSRSRGSRRSQVFDQLPPFPRVYAAVWRKPPVLGTISRNKTTVFRKNSRKPVRRRPDVYVRDQSPAPDASRLTFEHQQRAAPVACWPVAVHFFFFRK